MKKLTGFPESRNGHTFLEENVRERIEKTKGPTLSRIWQRG